MKRRIIRICTALVASLVLSAQTDPAGVPIEEAQRVVDEDGVVSWRTNHWVQFETQEALEAALASPVTVRSRGLHHRDVSRLIHTKDEADPLRLKETRYTELATGLSHRNEQGELQDAVAEFELIDGKAVARRTLTKVTLSANVLDAQAVAFVMPDGVAMSSRVLGLAYFDRKAGKSVTLAELKSSEGELNPASNQVLYRKAFDGIDADLRYTLTLAGVEQDVILNEAPLPPEAYGLDPDYTEIEAVTEFFSEVEPAVTQRVLFQEEDPIKRRDFAQPDLVTDEIDFGELSFGAGFAFGLWDASGPAKPLNALPMRKYWERTEGRSILREAIEYSALKPLLLRLPEQQAASVWALPPSEGRVLPQRQSVASRTESALRLALVDFPKTGVVLDYVTISGSASSYTFTNGSTYHVTGQFTVSGTLTIQSGAVVKFKKNSSAEVVISNSGYVYTPSSGRAYFVAEADNSVGETIVPGAPIGTYATVALNVYGATPAGNQLANLEIRNAATGITVYGNYTTCGLTDFVLKECTLGINLAYVVLNSTNLRHCAVTTLVSTSTATNNPTGTAEECDDCSGDDHGNSPALATTVTGGSSTSGSINCAGDEDYFKIVVASSSFLSVYTTGSTDTYGHLLNSSGNVLLPRDGGGAGSNFRIDYAVGAGTYYIRVRHPSGGTGSYTLYVEQTYPAGLIASLGTLAPDRNDFTGWVGFRFVVGTNDLVLSHLGRWVVSGNSGSHELRLSNVDGSAITGGSASIDTYQHPTNQFGYVALPSLLTLPAGTTNVLISHEVNGGDRWHNLWTDITLSADAHTPYSLYALDSSPTSLIVQIADLSYGPLNILYTLGANNAPTITTIADITVQKNGSDIVYFTVNDAQTPSSLTVTASSSNPTLIPNTGGYLSLSGSGTSRSLTVTPAANQTGTAVITVSVTDPSGAIASTVFTATVLPKLPTPTFTLGFDTDHTLVTNTATCSEGSPTMYYTTDHSDPSPGNGTTTPPVLTSPGVVKARAYQTGWIESGIATNVVSQAASVTFTPSGHAADQFTNGPMALTLSSQTGAVNRYKVGTGGSWNSVSQGTAATIDGIDSGNGTVEAFAYTATTLKSAHTTSGEYSFRLPQPTSSVSYTGSAQGVLTLSSSVSGATNRYTTDGSLPTGSSTAYVSPITNSASLKILARTYKSGYVPSGYTTAWINKLPSAVVATTSGVLAGNLTVNNALDVWLLPNFGFTNTYAENRASSGWTASGYSFNTNGPSTNFPGSFYASATNTLLHNTRLGVSYGRQYSMSVWAAGNGGSPNTLAGQHSYDGQNLVIGAEDVGGSYGSTYLTQALANGATTASLANSLVFSPVSGTYYLNFFIPLTNFSRTAAVLLGNQPNTVKDILQHTVFSTGTLQVTAVNTNTHTVTLSAAYSGPTLPVGTVIARRNAGSSYNYSLLVNQIIPSPWTHYTNSFTSLRLGAEQISPMFVYYVSSGSAGVTALEFWEGAQADRPKLHFTLDGTSNVYGQAGVAGPIKRVLNGNHEGDVRVGQRGNKYIDAAVAQRVITFSVGSVTATAQESQTNGSIDVTASTVTTGAAIYYTTDGSEPTTSSTLYTGPFTVPWYTLLKFKGFKTNYNSTTTKTCDGSLDTDSDGLPDWAEDLNGNQIVDSGETDFRAPNLKVFISRPSNNSVLP